MRTVFTDIENNRFRLGVWTNFQWGRKTLAESVELLVRYGHLTEREAREFLSPTFPVRPCSGR